VVAESNRVIKVSQWLASGKGCESGEWRPPMTRNVWSVTKKEGDMRERHRLTDSYNY
jgi:hypothetical protein